MAAYRYSQHDGAYGPASRGHMPKAKRPAGVPPIGTSDDDVGTPDYYAVLGVSEDASGEEIRQAFRALAKRWHPDHFATASPEEQARAEQHMKALLEAHAVLGDPVRRHEYERVRHEAIPWRPDGQGGPDGEYDHTGAHAHDYAYASAAHARAEARAGRYSVYGEGDRPAVNPNGAGQALAVLCIVFAVAIGAHLLAKGVGDGVWGFVEVGALLGLLTLAYVFFHDDSFIARAANDYMEREPRGSRAPSAHPVPRPAHAYTAPPSAYSHSATATDEDQRDSLNFERMVDDALASVPAEFANRLENVVVRVDDEPTEDDLRGAGVPPGHTLLGLYHGVPLTRQGIHATGPEVISIYRGPIERHCHHDPERIRAQVRATVLHELAHHFGIDHDDMPEWVK